MNSKFCQPSSQHQHQQQQQQQHHQQQQQQRQQQQSKSFERDDFLIGPGENILLDSDQKSSKVKPLPSFQK